MIRPINGYIVVQMDESPKEVRGIILDQSAAPKPTSGRVVALCETVTVLKSGDKVMIHAYSGQEWEFEKTPYKVIKAEDVMGVFAEA